MQRVSINGDGEWEGEGRGDNPEVVILTLLHLENLQWWERVSVDMFAIVIYIVVATCGSEIDMYEVMVSLIGLEQNCGVSSWTLFALLCFL